MLFSMTCITVISFISSLTVISFPFLVTVPQKRVYGGSAVGLWMLNGKMIIIATVIFQSSPGSGYHGEAFVAILAYGLNSKKVMVF